MTADAIAAALSKEAVRLETDHFSDVWVAKTQKSRFVTPFTHDSYETMFRWSNPFLQAIDD